MFYEAIKNNVDNYLGNSTSVDYVKSVRMMNENACRWIPFLVDEVEKLRDQLCAAESELEDMKNDQWKDNDK